MKNKNHIKISSFIALLLFYGGLSNAAEIKNTPPVSKMIKNSLKVKNYSFYRKLGKENVNIVLKYKNKKIMEFNGISTNIVGQDLDLNGVYVYKMIPDGAIQAIVFNSDGGNRGSSLYTVLDLNEDGQIKTLFQSNDYLSSGFFSIVDLNNDGDDEILDKVGSQFVAPDLIPYESVNFNIPLIYAFDKSKNAFLPANDKFFQVYQDDINSLKQKVVKNEIQTILPLACYYWYSGKEKEGWEILDNNFINGNKAGIKNEIQEILKDDKYINNLKMIRKNQ